MISGGTRSGIPGLAGEVAETLKQSGECKFKLVDYRPERLPDDAPADQIWALGVTHLLISDLTKIEALQVRSLALDKSYLDPGHDAVALGRQQKVDGSVERVGSQIRLVPRLIRVADASVLWSEPHQRRVEDLFGLQQELVTDIAAEIRLKLRPADKARLASPAFARLTTLRLIFRHLGGARPSGRPHKLSPPAKVGLAKGGVKCWTNPSPICTPGFSSGLTRTQGSESGLRLRCCCQPWGSPCATPTR